MTAQRALLLERARQPCPPSRGVIAVMAKAPRPGRVKTRLTPPLSRAGSARLARCFLLDTIAGVAQVERARRVVLYTPRTSRQLFRRMAGGFILVPQRSGDLGRRLASAFRDLLHLGLGPVVVIGTDVPSLPTSILEEALSRLDDPRVDAVLGPSEDGGYYLVGLRKLSPDLFRRIAWSTPKVFEQTIARSRAQRLRIRLLPRWWDVDTPEDLDRLRRWLAAHPRADLAHTRRFFEQRARGRT
jgi:rSAM/selenodomain-associated transferase 1